MPIKVDHQTVSADGVGPSEIDYLVQEIRERLKLRDGGHCGRRRPSPYAIPGRCRRGAGGPRPGPSLASRKRCECFPAESPCLRRYRGGAGSELSDSRLFLKKLLEEQTLISEAVRRLQSKMTAGEGEEEDGGV